MSYLLQYSLLCPSQHGFLAGKLSITNILQTTYQWAFSLDRGESVDVLYLDQSKAFDSVVHSKLVYNLRLMVFVTVYFHG